MQRAHWLLVRSVQAALALSVLATSSVGAPFTFESPKKTPPRALDGLPLFTASHSRRFFVDERRRLSIEVQQSESIRPEISDPATGLTRDAVVRLYRNHEAALAKMPALDWTGDTSRCDPGSISALYQQAVIDRVNLFRSLAGLSSVSLQSPARGGAQRAQAAALLMSRNGKLSHAPEVHWLCFGTAYEGDSIGSLGKDGALRSNLALSSSNEFATPRVVDAYVDDAGATNQNVGHRRGVLDSGQTAMAVGAVPARAEFPAVNALLWIDFASRAPQARRTTVAWPPAGYVPFQLLPIESNRWSFQRPHTDFSEARVTLSIGDQTFTVTDVEFTSGVRVASERGEPACDAHRVCVPEDAIVFRPPIDPAGKVGVSYRSPGGIDKRYRIRFEGIRDLRVGLLNLEYDVTVIDTSNVGPGL
jgi:hypothetical protein